MADPFAKASVETGTARDILAALNDYDYPTIISTKGRLRDISRFKEQLQTGSYYVRLSIAASKFDKRVVEPGTPSEDEIFESAAMLTEARIPVCVRIQPIFPDTEEEAIRLALRARNAGAVAVSLEYLKIPREQKSPQFKRLDEIYEGRLLDLYRSRGLSYLGREVSLSLAYRKRGMAQMKSAINALGSDVGIAENELLHYGDLAGCCNGASSHLRGAVDFDYNVPAAIKSMGRGRLTLAAFSNKWAPTGSIARHFNSTSRLGLKGAEANWRAFFLHRWRTKGSFFNPTFFDGVSFNGDLDADGEPVYHYVPAEEFRRTVSEIHHAG
jgi:hypothetical protein